MTEKFEIAVICGSMRFYNSMLKLAEELTKEKHIVLMPFTVKDDTVSHEMLDLMHRQKIDMADKVYVVTNRETYIGESTRGEIEYAKAQGKWPALIDEEYYQW